MSRVIAVMACGFMLAACSTTMPSLDFMKSAPQAVSLAIESEPPGAEAKTSLGQSCRTPCQLSVQPGSEFSVTLALSGYQPQTVSVRPEAGSPTAAAPRLAPNPVHVDLQAVAPPKKPAAKKKKLVAKAGRSAATDPKASATPTPASTAPSTLTEMAPSATNRDSPESRGSPPIMHSPDIPRMTPKPAWRVAILQRPWKPDGRYGWLPAARAARTMVE